MDRRSFLGSIGVVSVSTLIPAGMGKTSEVIDFKEEPTVGEAAFVKHLMNNYPADDALELIKFYGFKSSMRKKVMLTDFFRQFIVRNPEIKPWLKERISIKEPNSNLASYRYHKRKHEPIDEAREEYDNVIRVEFKKLEDQFGLHKCYTGEIA